ncbi:head-to-tail adaptor [Arthrobacter phage Mufasa8]|uniref:Head-to-tail adaptor n=1 Tax=Arthrobacter phage Mufasa8 TaxID=2656526 RepID=A0A649VM83_9CAUD|nr:head-to-tail adaptor [Arthrobacter phage Mufasa8]QGJ93458.1 head-to-tail adaptor [Arthrobacter phage Mufasa8]
MMLVNPTAATLTNRGSYITVNEFKNHPNGVDTRQLVPGGSPQVNAQALKDVIARASSMADNICQKVLGATVDVQTGDHTTGPGGTIKAPLDNTPIIGIIEVALGLGPNSLTPMQSLDGISMGSRVLTIPGAWGGYYAPSRVYSRITYMSGWANTTLTAQATVGATSLQVADGVGIVPGQALTLSSASATETVHVAPDFDPPVTHGPVTVTLAQPTAYGYSIDDSLSAFPAAIKLAVILLTSSLIKNRGSDALVMGSLQGGPDHEADFGDNGENEYGLAVAQLSPYIRTA